jgi:uncharacterized protein YvpB
MANKTKETDADDVKIKVADALRTLVIAYHHKQITKKDMAAQLAHWAKHGLEGYTQGSPVKNIIGWELFSEFAHELKFVAAVFYDHLQKEKEWVDIVGLVNFLNANGLKVTTRTIERENAKFEKAKIFYDGEHYRFKNHREKEYHKSIYLELYREYLKK